ncbi:hypothetical protein RhiirC2_783244 [Rhizophagus irregularis]|uniref:Uncharacterized protein n=1 Tax=Rhizophagus irregularis TaxID=588596 RepID=A0A2N1N186_9GLOM|nr:hypothetical protein RhiirC2_783244 [Rhizophagus irregularis]
MGLWEIVNSLKNFGDRFTGKINSSTSLAEAELEYQVKEAARKDKHIKSSLESNVELYVNSSELIHLLQNLKSIFTTSDATISSSLEMIENYSNNTSICTNEVYLPDWICKIIIKRASLFKCPRCLNYNAQ